MDEPVTPLPGEDLDLEPLGERPPASSGPRMLIPLFLVPLLIVAVVVGVFLAISSLVGDSDTPLQLIDRVESGGVNDRWQAAATLSEIARLRPEELSDPAVRERIRGAFRSTAQHNHRLRQYLATVLGQIGDREAAPMVLEAAQHLAKLRADSGGEFPGDEVESGRQFFAYLLCLGELADPVATDFLLGLAGDPDTGVRQTVASALGTLFRAAETVPEDVTEALATLHQDPEAWVRMNAALSLAKVGSDLGLPTLEFMLYRENLKRHGLQYPDRGEYTVRSHDPAQEPIQAALLSIWRLVELHPDRSRFASSEGPLLAALTDLVEKDPNPSLRELGAELMEHVRGAQ